MPCGKGDVISVNMLDAVWRSMISSACLASAAPIPATAHRPAALSSPCLCVALSPFIYMKPGL